ncbi:hypothetical protein PHIM7_170 [Sinorhizobium phage phiM7]|uniref:Uncharacterized protein n=2 Tax=Emdodecavirus TaxID=1980937 RepID=S5MB69_9CAUD|nr:hypothetical protein AB690_gp329 [Sinorhizobium phage phiM12]YP_009601295.1 hypothetical protein FDH46_gp308 [Sinorhizobium phage phiM7]AGR47873.1 hypothetical protein SmphiM12_241 [Sinorhizobium phage phiM12]AKF12715.1 hypothetical protein PHIM7_170 [Sinorhizobium phage phiM7]AKF13075.1 hypothetical protein PHIM19_170 [Sinorhizobium phage phiM19]
MTDVTHSLESRIISNIRKTMPTEETTIELVSGFHWEVTPELAKEYHEWIDRLESDNAPTGAVGGRFTYELTPTSIGLVVFVRDDVTKERFDLNVYEWF